MNIFYVPSWYPSVENSIYGTFVKEQIEMLAKHNTNWNLGVSLWGQGKPSHMLWARDHFINITKILKSKPKKTVHTIENISEYICPTLTWTRKVFHGNLSGLIRANQQNFRQFTEKVGKVNVIHAQATYPGALIAQALSEEYGIPYIVSIRMSPFPFKEFLTKSNQLKAWVRKPLEGASKLVATSTSLQATLQSHRFSNTTVIHNPVDTDFFKPSGYEPEVLTLLTIGRIEHQKGIDLLIGAIAILSDDFNGKVRIGGEGSLKAQYQKLAQEKGVSDKIVWLGQLTREQVRVEMQQCSFYVLPSRHETFGNVLLEAMACGKPVIATKCGGPTGIVSEKVGMLCEVENPEDLAEKIRAFISPLKNYSEKVTRKHVETKFSVRVFSNQMTTLYSSIE